MVCYGRNKDEYESKFCIANIYIFEIGKAWSDSLQFS